MPTGLSSASSGRDRGQYQWASGVGHGSDDQGDYVSFIKIPEGTYRAKDAPDWAPEIRCRRSDVIYYLCSNFKNDVINQLGGIKVISLGEIKSGSPYDIDVKQYVPDGWQRLTTNNFSIAQGVGAWANVHVYGNQSTDGTYTKIEFWYESGTGILHITSTGNTVYNGGLALWVGAKTLLCSYI